MTMHVDYHNDTCDAADARLGHQDRFLSRRRVIQLLGAGVAVGWLGGGCAPHRIDPMRLDSKGGQRRTRVVVLGSGVTGLCAAALLSRCGYDLTVLEAHPAVCGGHARTLTVDGLPFSAGPQYVWDFTPGSDGVGARVLEYLGLQDRLHFVGMAPDGFERVVIGQEAPFDVPMGLERFCEALTQRMPQDRAGLRHFFEVVDDMYAGTRLLYRRGTYLESAPDMVFAVLTSTHLSLRAKLTLSRYYNESLQRVFDDCALSPLTRRLLLGHAGVFAENPERLSAGVYAAATGCYHSGSSTLAEGFGALVAALCEVVVEGRGRVENSKRVVKLNRQDKKIVSLTCEDGSEYGCDAIISTLAPRATCALVDGCAPQAYTYEVSNPLSGCYVVVRPFAALEQLRGRNLWWQRSPEPIEFANPDMLASPTMLYAGARSHAEKGVGVVLFAPGHFEQSRLACQAGGTAAEEFRRAAGDQIISAAERHLLPGLAGNVQTSVVKTPWDTFQEVGAERGNGYGRRPDVHNVLRGLTAFPAAQNLALACATVGQPGIATAFQTAVTVFRRMTGVTI